MKLRDLPLIILDGAMGTNLQRMDLPPSVWEGHAGCNEILNRSCKDAIVELHRSFLLAGAMAVETNTFGANAVVLSEYGLQGEVETLNRLAVENARAAISDVGRGFIVGSVGPTTKLPSLGHIGTQELGLAYTQQIRALVDAGADALLIETCQDLLQVRTALVAAFDVLEDRGADLPVMVSVTIENIGTMLLGTPISAVAATVEPFPVMSLGLNCATGPSAMRSHLQELTRIWPRRISVVPNAGLPVVENGATKYELAPSEFASTLADFVQSYGVSVVGGCCGTTQEHIRALVEATQDIVPAQKPVEPRPALSTLFDRADIEQEIPPLIVGERMNANGSKKFREHLLADDFDAAADMGRQQEMNGAHLLDLSVAYAGRDEAADMQEMISRLRKEVRRPLVIDSTTPAVIELALRDAPGRCLVNSVNLEDGGDNLRRVLRIVRRYGAAVVALAIGPNGMAMTAEEKLRLCREIYDIATQQFGLRPSDLFFDMLTFTVGSGDPSLRLAAAQTLDAVRRAKQELPGSFTLLGISNVSFGLPKRSRPVLNSMFLHEAVSAGLTAAIVDAANVLPLSRISEEDRRLCLDLLYDRREGESEPLSRIVERFSNANTSPPRTVDVSRFSAEKRLEDKVLDGDTDGLEDILAELLARTSAVDIVNRVLVPAMRRVGELFGSGAMLLPFVLKSAEVMKRSVDLLEPHMARADQPARTKILLATVRGDVHDIGKNLVDIILSNNGYEVHNIGINVPTEVVIKKAKELEVHAIGLSGLLVKSALVMQDSIPMLAEAGLSAPVLLGGAALTPRFVATACAQSYPSPVVYCADAFAGLSAMRELEAGTLRSTVAPPETPKERSIADTEERLVVNTNIETPSPPFWGARYEQAISVERFLPLLNKQALFRGRWGYRRAKLSVEDYAALIESEVEPTFTAMVAQGRERNLLSGRAAYGYYRAYSSHDDVFIEHEGTTHKLSFPRQSFPPHQCIADYVKPLSQGGDVVGLFVVGLGQPLVDTIAEKFRSNAYRDYLLWHGLAVELTDALAEYWHSIMRSQLDIATSEPKEIGGYITQEFRGSRYGFGYPACPDLAAHEVVFRLLRPQAIGIELSETMEMIPELSTSAIVLHHPDAKYFAV